ncbi:MAG TPA: SDR family NAD(P)-dependent oxidoreductase, partial [Baekduia sp.]|nr:SDR family NAD(P)-dependent oxidoreductase [Baekduia sp.]
LDVLVNNAGIIHVSPLIEETLTAWNGLFAVNATGTLLGMQAAIPAMWAVGAGSIINVASISASPVRKAMSPTRRARRPSSA